MTEKMRKIEYRYFAIKFPTSLQVKVAIRIVTAQTIHCWAIPVICNKRSSNNNDHSE